MKRQINLLNLNLKFVYSYLSHKAIITKDKVKELAEHMPDTFSVDELVERVLILEKIGQAQKEIENGEGMDWEDFKKEMDKW